MQMQPFTSPLLLALLTSLLSICTLALPTSFPLNPTSNTDINLNTPVLEDLASESILHYYASNLHVPTAKIGRSDQQEQDCTPIGFKHGHKICDPRCDPENCNNLPVRELVEGQVASGGEGEVKGGRPGRWFMNSPPVEERRVSASL
ncbi:hypothetical protein DL98DRAFT_618990 [Cadophora sp. DSE1049]|nr:hypothetical protein DL98DRAFT_618990 [Cadophora sp. DSE1049]